MRVITCEQLRQQIRVDEQTGKLYWIAPSKFQSRRRGHEAGSRQPNQNGKCYWTVGINGRKYRRSHIVLALLTGQWPTDQVDHINGDSLDDRPCNLRQATPTQNAWNHKRRSKASPLPMGVRIVASSGRFQARIAVNKQVHYLGTYSTPEAAHQIYLAARAKHFGEFA